MQPSGSVLAMFRAAAEEVHTGLFKAMTRAIRAADTREQNVGNTGDVGGRGEDVWRKARCCMRMMFH